MLWGPSQPTSVTTLFLRRKTALYVQRLPGGGCFVLGDAERVFRRGSLRGAIQNAGARAADVQKRQAHRAAYRRVRPVAGGEASIFGVETDFLDDGAVHDDERRHRVGRRLNRVERELGRQHRPDRGHENGHVRRKAAGHHGVHGECFGSDDSLAGRHEADFLIGRQACSLHHSGDALGGRGDDGQAVSPSPRFE